MKNFKFQTGTFTLRGLVEDVAGLAAICVLLVVGLGLPTLA